MEQFGGNSMYRFNIVRYCNSKTNGWREYAPCYDDSVVEELDVIKFLKDIKCMLHSKTFNNDETLRIEYSRERNSSGIREVRHVSPNGAIIDGVPLSQCFLKAKIIRTTPQETSDDRTHESEGYQYFDARWSGKWPSGATRPYVSESISPQHENYSVIVLLCIKNQFWGTDSGRPNRTHHEDGGTVLLTMEDERYQDLELFLCSFGCLVDGNGVAKLYSPDKVYDTFAYSTYHSFPWPKSDAYMRSMDTIKLKMDNINNLLDFLYLVATIQQIPDFDFNSELHGLGITVPDSKMFAEFALDFLNSLKGGNIEQLLIKYKDKTIKKRKKYKIAEVLFRVYWERMMDHQHSDWWEEYTAEPCDGMQPKKLPKKLPEKLPKKLPERTESGTKLPRSWSSTSSEPLSSESYTPRGRKSHTPRGRKSHTPKKEKTQEMTETDLLEELEDLSDFSIGQDETTQRLLTLFQKFDVGNIGKLDKDRIANLLQNMGAEITDEELDLVMTEIDVEGTGLIDFEELVTWWFNQEGTSIRDRLHAALMSNPKILKSPKRKESHTPERRKTGTPEREKSHTPEREKSHTPRRRKSHTPERKPPTRKSIATEDAKRGGLHGLHNDWRERVQHLEEEKVPSTSSHRSSSKALSTLVEPPTQTPRRAGLKKKRNRKNKSIRKKSKRKSKRKSSKKKKSSRKKKSKR